jgi:predicted ATPase
VVRLEWWQKSSSYPFQPWQLSDGTIRFICLATALLQPEPPSTIVIDEPELGLHPFALEVLAGLFHEASEHIH